MSFKIFSLQLLGKIKSVESVENQREGLREDYLEFQKVESSEELQQYLELGKWLESEEFKNEKNKIEALQYKGSREFKQSQEFKRLKKASKIQERSIRIFVKRAVLKSTETVLNLKGK